jgi:membrane-bound inhibitor of C-type lysozyme
MFPTRFRAVPAAALAVGVLLLQAGCALDAGEKSAALTPSRMRCGDQLVTLGRVGDSLNLTAGGADYVMHPVPAASGAKYEAAGDPTTTFWSKGDRALLVVKGKSHPECFRADR